MGWVCGGGGENGAFGAALRSFRAHGEDDVRGGFAGAWCALEPARLCSPSARHLTAERRQTLNSFPVRAHASPRRVFPTCFLHVGKRFVSSSSPASVLTASVVLLRPAILGTTRRARVNVFAPCVVNEMRNMDV